MLFRAGKLHLAAPAFAVQAIHDNLLIEPVAGTCRWFLGLAVTRGRLLPVSDLAAFLRQPPATGFTLQVNPALGISGLRVDAVQGISVASLTRIKLDALDGGANVTDSDALSGWKINEDNVDYRVVDVARLLQLPRFLNITETVS